MHACVLSSVSIVVAPGHIIWSQSHGFFPLQLPLQLCLPFNLFQISQPLPPGLLLEFAKWIESITLWVFEWVFPPATSIGKRCAPRPVVKHVICLVTLRISKRVGCWRLHARAATVCGYRFWTRIFTWAKQSVTAICGAGQMALSSAVTGPL